MAAVSPPHVFRPVCNPTKARFKRSIIFSNFQILVNIIDHVGRQGQYIDIKEAAIKILTLASIISNHFDIIDANRQYSEGLTQ